jgi:hypothetical protein
MNINVISPLSLHYKLIKEIEEAGNSTVWNVKDKNNERDASDSLELARMTNSDLVFGLTAWRKGKN